MSMLMAVHAGRATCRRSARRWTLRQRRSAVAVRTYNYALCPPSSWRRASRRRRISSSAPVSRSTGSSAACRAARAQLCTEPLLAGRDLMLQLVDRTPRSGRAHRRARRVHARSRAARRRVDDDRPVARSQRSPVRRPQPMTFLGRAIAHEIGHLLLGSREHPQSGPDAGLVVARRASRPETGALGILRARGRTDAPGAARQVRTATRLSLGGELT